MSVDFDFSDHVILITGASGALGSAITNAFKTNGGIVCGADIVEPSDDDALIDSTGIDFYHGDFTDESDVERIMTKINGNHGQIDILCNIAGTWRGGSPIHETELNEFEFLFDINLKTMFLASKHALPYLRASNGSIVSVSARSSLTGGECDGPYRASKAGVRLLTETIANENTGVVRANAIMPSIIDTPTNREMMPDADFEEWVDPMKIAEVVLFLCSDAATVTSGAAIPVYGEA